MRRVARAALDKRYLDAWFLAAMTVGAIVLFRLIEPSWLNSQTLQSIITQNGPLAIVAMAMTFSIISRHIDLSPGSMLATPLMRRRRGGRPRKSTNSSPTCGLTRRLPTDRYMPLPS